MLEVSQRALEIMDKSYNLILFGYKSSGKTYFGKLLAQKLGMVFIDTDLLIESLYEKEYKKNHSCREISLTLGEEAFRKLEENVVESLKMVTNTVIALGGGSVLSPKNCLLLKEIGRLIYLKIDKETIKNRMFKEAVPSFLDPKDPKASFEKMYEKRKPVYENLSSFEVQISGKTDQQVLEELKDIRNRIFVSS